MEGRSNVRTGLPGLVGLSEFEGGWAHERFVSNALTQRAKVLSHVSRSEAPVLAEEVGGRVEDLRIDDSTEWAVSVSPLPKLRIFYFFQKYSPEFDDAVKALYSKDALEIGLPAEDVSEFTILYVNAMIYAIKKVLKKNAPSLSRYL